MPNERGTYGSNGVSHDLRVQAVSNALQEAGGRYVGVALRRTDAPGPVWFTYATTWRPQIDAWIQQQLATPGYVYVVAFDRTIPRWSEEGRALVEVSAQVATTSGTYVGAASSAGGSAARLILGVVALGGAVLWMRHQSKQVEELYKTAGLPYQSFTSGLGKDVKKLASGARERLHRITAPKPVLTSKIESEGES